MPIRYVDEPVQAKPKIRFLDEQAQPEKTGSDDFSTYGVSMGVVDPIYGAGQLIPRALEKITSLGGLAENPVSRAYGRSAEKIDKGYNQVSGQYEQQRANPDNFDWGRMTGNVISPINWIGTGAGAAPTLGGKVLTGASMGAASAATQPIKDTENYWTNKALQMGLGASGGLAGTLAGAGINKILNPVQDAAKIAMEKSGVNLTLGQKLGGIYDDAEQKLQSAPIFGSMISKRRNEALQQWNTATLDDIVSPLGAKVTGQGHEGIKQAQDIISNAYEQAKASMNPFQLDAPAKQAIIDAHNLVSQLPETEQKAFNNVINRLQTSVQAGDIIAPEEYKTLTSVIGKKIADFGGSSDAYQRQLAEAFSSLNEAVTGAAKRQNPQQGAMMDAADAAFAKMVRVDAAARAAATNKVNTGVFTPSQLMSAVRGADRSARDRATAGGDALMQDVAQRGMNVLGSSVPDSGTAGRNATMAALIGAIPTTLLSPATALTAAGVTGAGAGLYTKSGQKLAKALLTERPQISRQLGTAAQKYAPYLASPMALPLARQIGD